MKRWIGFLALVTVLCAGCAEETGPMQTQAPAPAQATQAQTAISSPTTAFEIGENGYQVIGQKGRVAVMAHDLIAGQGNKDVWFLWGDAGGKSIRVLAEQQATGKRVELLEKRPLGGPLHGADAHLPSSLVFPDGGKWRMDVYVDEALYGQIEVSVKRAYPATDEIEIRKSADEIKVNGGETLEISVKREQTPENLLVKAKQIGSQESPIEVSFRNNGEFIDAQDHKRMSTYIGPLRFPNAGEWAVEVLGKTVKVTVLP